MLCVLNKIEVVNSEVFNMIIGITESKSVLTIFRVVLDVE